MWVHTHIRACTRTHTHTHTPPLWDTVSQAHPSLSLLLVALILVLVSWSYCNKLQQTWRLKIALTVSRFREPGIWNQGGSSTACLEALGKNPALASLLPPAPLRPLARRHATAIPATVSSFVCLHVSPFLCCLRSPVIGFQAHLNPWRYTERLNLITAANTLTPNKVTCTDSGCTCSLGATIQTDDSLYVPGALGTIFSCLWGEMRHSCLPILAVLYPPTSSTTAFAVPLYLV